VGYQKNHRRILADPYYKDTVANLRQAREAAGLSQTTVARTVGVAWETVSAWERLVMLPSLFHFIEWCKALGFHWEKEV
jgi:DNA-binding XRE family transcriptional regulator